MRLAEPLAVGAVKLTAVAMACAGLWSYAAFTSHNTPPYASEFRDQSENRVDKTPERAKIGESFMQFASAETLSREVPDVLPGEWPCFRGPGRDNLARDGVPLARTWGEQGPKVLWRKALGEGYAGAVIAQGRVYVLDYVEADASDALRCFELATGEELWRRGYRNPIRRNHGKSRTVPAYAQGVVVTLGPSAHVMAVDARSGALLWARDLVEEYRAKVPQWYAGQCPLIDGERVVLGIGGEEVLLAAFDLKTGSVLWEVENDLGLQMSHASILRASLCGREQYVYVGLGGVVGCGTDGERLWSARDWKPAVCAPTPVTLDDHRLFLTAGYGVGGAILSVEKRDGAWSAAIERSWKPTQGPASEQQTPLVVDRTLFVIQPKDAGGRRGELVAANVAELPKIHAASGKEDRFGLGPYLYADGAFWVVDDAGVLSVYAYDGTGFSRLARHRVLPGVDSWAPVALAGGFMILRDANSMVCLDLRVEGRP